PHPLRLTERDLRDRVTDPVLDPLSAIRDFVDAVAFAPLLRAVSVADCHSDNRDRRVHTPERDDAGDAAPGPNDYLPADLLAEDAVRRADVAAALRGDRRGFQAE